LGSFYSQLHYLHGKAFGIKHLASSHVILIKVTMDLHVRNGMPHQMLLHPTFQPRRALVKDVPSAQRFALNLSYEYASLVMIDEHLGMLYLLIKHCLVLSTI